MDAPNLQVLLTLLERESASRDEAAIALRQALDHQARVNAQSEQLAAYRTEYVQRWQGEFTRSSSIEILACYRSFMDRLDQAVQQQAALAERARVSAERNRAMLVDAEQRVASITRLIERRQAHHRKALERREQKLLDEAAQRAGWLASQGSVMASV